MGLAWERLGSALKAARADSGATQEEVAADLGVSRATIQKLERGEPHTKVTPTMRAYAVRVGWTAASVDIVLQGGDPVVAPTPDARDDAAAKAISQENTGLPLRVVDELEDDGPLLDSVVIPLGDDGRMVVVVKGKPNASPEEIKRNLEAWRRAQRHLQSVGDDASTEVANEA
ncbi:helix-turn-helix domain-containing protein [Streptomyces sp. DW26H14]|uniref:helix-turn-helix domain-containing protein n=1 Tax=Streptomyces sp. DW26H14 TaxID=3435395 RepID=UPI00403D7964